MIAELICSAESPQEIQRSSALDLLHSVMIRNRTEILAEIRVPEIGDYRRIQQDIHRYPVTLMTMMIPTDDIEEPNQTDVEIPVFLHHGKQYSKLRLSMPRGHFMSLQISSLDGDGHHLLYPNIVDAVVYPDGSVECTRVTFDQEPGGVPSPITEQLAWETIPSGDKPYQEYRVRRDGISAPSIISIFDSALRADTLNTEA